MSAQHKYMVIQLTVLCCYISNNNRYSLIGHALSIVAAINVIKYPFDFNKIRKLFFIGCCMQHFF